MQCCYALSSCRQGLSEDAVLLCSELYLVVTAGSPLRDALREYTRPACQHTRSSLTPYPPLYKRRTHPILVVGRPDLHPQRARTCADPSAREVSGAVSLPSLCGAG